MVVSRMLPWSMWFFPLSFFAFQFILRLFPGLVMPEFFERYHIGATEFGIFASLYYLGYAGMQIPMAFLLDKFGPRNIITCSALLCGLSCYILVSNDSWGAALLSRFLVGVGSVAGFLGTSKVISMWFPKARYARLVGLTFSFGLLGALYGGRPVSLMITQMGWEKALTMLGCVAVGLGSIIFLFVRDKTTAQVKPAPLVSSLKFLLTNKPLLILAFANFLMVGALEGFADVWGVPYLMTAQHLSKVNAASIVSFVFIGMLFGGPILAFFAEKFKAHYQITVLAGLMMSILLASFIFFNAHLNIFLMSLMMFTIGILCCYQVLVFAIGTNIVPMPLMGLTVAFLNCINMLGGSFFHTFIGRFMDFMDPTHFTGNVKIYSIDAYTYTLLLIPGASVVGALMVWYSMKKQQQILPDLPPHPLPLP